MLLSQIQVAVFTRLNSASGLLPIAYPQKGIFQSNDQPYAAVSIEPFANREVVYCDGVMRSGYILINVFYPDNSGVVVPTQEAEKFIELFPENLEFDGITIPDTGDIKSAIDDTDHKGWFFIPVLIYFEVR